MPPPTALLKRQRDENEAGEAALAELRRHRRLDRLAQAAQTRRKEEAGEAVRQTVRGTQGPGALEQFHAWASNLAKDEKCGPDVWDRGDEIRVVFPRHKHPTPQQMRAIIECAMKKGWTTLYVYKEDGRTPDIRLAMALTQQMAEMGVSERIRCCLDAAGMPPLEAVKERQAAQAQAQAQAAAPAEGGVAPPPPSFA